MNYGSFRLTKHVEERIVQRGINRQDVLDVLNGTVGFSEYPHRPEYPTQRRLVSDEKDFVLIIDLERRTVPTIHYNGRYAPVA